MAATTAASPSHAHRSCMTGELFRREVLESRRSIQLGGISLAQPARPWVLAGFSVAAAATVIGFLVCGQYSRRSRVTGQLVPSLGLSTVAAPVAGVVGRLFPEEGDLVAAGDPLARIDVPRATAAGQDVLTVIRQELAVRELNVQRLGDAQVAQIDAQMAGASRQLAMAGKELRQVKESLATRGEQIRLGRDTLERYRRIAHAKYVSQLQVNQQEQALLELTGERQTLERQATSIYRGMAQMEQSLHELRAQRQAQLATIRRDRALLNQERVQQETHGELLMKAPVAGLVASRLVQGGQALKAGQPLLSLLPRGSELRAQLMVPSRAIGFVKPGDIVLLRYEAYPYQKFGHYRGRVRRISRSAVNPGESTALAGNGQVTEPYYRVSVTLEAQTVMTYGRQEPLRPGMALEADILGEHRKIYEWLLEPLYSLRGIAGSAD
jgi:membrane fusion protein